MMNFRVEIQVKNGPLWKAIFNAYGSVSGFCKAHGLNPTTVGEFLNLKVSPLNENFDWRPVTCRIADALGVLVDDIFPEACRIRLEKSKASFEMEAEELAQLMTEQSPLKLAMNTELADDLNSIIDRLSPNEQTVLRYRFGLGDTEEKTLEQCGEIMGLSRERIRQIEYKALRKLRNPKMKWHKKLVEHAEYD